jgi:hypothetical protein
LTARRTSPEERLRAIAFVRRVLDKPYVAGAQGPDAYDCWSLARICQKELFERELPVALVDPHQLRHLIETIEHSAVHDSWPETSEPAHGALVTMAHARFPSHIGVWLDLDGGGVLHTLEHAGVAFEVPLSLRAVGWGHLRFHNYVPRQGMISAGVAA